MKKLLPAFAITLALFFSSHIVIAHAQTDCSSVSDDNTYEACCTGQSSEDSGTCNNYALSYAENNNLNSDCSSIDDGNESECCGSSSSPMCVAYESYTSADSTGEAGAGAQCPNTSIASDSAYEQQCTGQSGDDSASCNAYAVCDDGGNSECANITSDSIYNDCCNGDSGDSAVCVAYNTSTAADANSPANPSAAAKSGSSAATARQSAISSGAARVVSAIKNAVSNSGTSTPVAVTTPGGDGLIPCDGPDCNFNSVIQLINNLTNFFFGTLLLPIFILMLMYLGFTYLTAGGKPGQHAKLASMAKHMFIGLLLMLCAWLIVHTLLSVLGYNDTLGFFGK